MFEKSDDRLRSLAGRGHVLVTFSTVNTDRFTGMRGLGHKASCACYVLYSFCSLRLLVAVSGKPYILDSESAGTLTPNLSRHDGSCMPLKFLLKQ